MTALRTRLANMMTDLAGSHVNLRYLIPQAALLGTVLIAGISWRQWK